MGCRASGYEVWVSQLQPHTRIDSPGIVRGLVIAVFCRVKTIVRTRVRVRQHKHLARVSNDTIVGSVLNTVNTAIPRTRTHIPSRAIEHL